MMTKKLVQVIHQLANPIPVATYYGKTLFSVQMLTSVTRISVNISVRTLMAPTFAVVILATY